MFDFKERFDEPSSLRIQLIFEAMHHGQEDPVEPYTREELSSFLHSVVTYTNKSVMSINEMTRLFMFLLLDAYKPVEEEDVSDALVKAAKPARGHPAAVNKLLDEFADRVEHEKRKRLARLLNGSTLAPLYAIDNQSGNAYCDPLDENGKMVDMAPGEECERVESLAPAEAGYNVYRLRRQFYYLADDISDYQSPEEMVRYGKFIASYRFIGPREERAREPGGKAVLKESLERPSSTDDPPPPF